MKICPICEKEISGTWCKKCFKKVTPWEVRDGIYINRSHDKDDKNCYFHGTEQQTVRNNEVHRQQAVRNNEVHRQQAVRNNEVHGLQAVRNNETYKQQKNSSTHNTVQKRKNSPAKIVGMFIAIYAVFFIVIAVIGMFMTNRAHSLVSDFYENSQSNEYTEQEEFEYEEDDDSSEEAEYYANLIKKMNYEDYSSTDNYLIYYYSAEEVLEHNVKCDSTHFDVTGMDMVELLYEIHPNTEFQFYDLYSGYGDNFIAKYKLYDDYVAYLDSYYELYTDGLSIYVGQDTVSNMAHYIEYWYDENEAEFDLLFQWFEVMYPKGLEAKQELIDFIENCEECEYLDLGENGFDTGGYDIEVYKDGYIDITIYPKDIEE